ncbi:hypothetical protein [Paracoccus sp. ME4]|uniref:hypothetical protein n=1 Tax=Paracoccus sp. ME4 TaxID=3138066 RepID=UPI00398A51E1
MRHHVIRLAAVAAACLSLPTLVSAGDFTVQSGISTLGFTVEPAYRISGHWGARMPIATGNRYFDASIGDRNLSGTLMSDAVGVLADYHPFAGGLRISGGLIHTHYRATALSETVTYNDRSSQVFANIDQSEKLSPMLALGYDAMIGPAAISAAMGGIFTNAFRVTGGQTGSLIEPADVEAELNNIRTEVNAITPIPYVSLGVSFAF